MLGVGDEPHVPLGDGILGQLGQDAQHAHISVFFDGVTQDVLVAATGSAVQDHAADVDLRIEGRQTENDGGHGARDLGAVGDDDHRTTQELGQFRRGTGTVHVLSVVQAAVPLEEGQVRPFRPRAEKVFQHFGRQ
ncbi:hypothetical protein DSECCO2_476440 [anaerobic digester metagenome]